MSESNGQDVWRPGQDCQAVATAKALGQDVDRIHGAPWGVVGTLGDSICYVGVNDKVEAVHAAMGRRISERDLPVRLLAPNYSGGVSDGQRNGTPQMRYSLIGRETTNDGLSLHFEGNDIRGLVAVVACDKPPVGATAAIMERNVPAVVLSDGSIRPGTDPLTGETIDLASASGALASRPWPHSRAGRTLCRRAAAHVHLQHDAVVHRPAGARTAAHGVARVRGPAANRGVPRAGRRLPGDHDAARDHARDIATPAAFRNATIVAIAMGGSTNVVLHAPEIARAAGIDFWEQVMSQEEFNQLSRTVPVLINARPFGKYSMVDIDAVGGLPVAKVLLAAGWPDGSPMTCTGETLAEQVARIDPPAPDGEVVHPVSAPFKPTGGLRMLSGNVAPEGGAVLKLAGVETGIVDNRFVGRARVFDSEQGLLHALMKTPSGT